MKLASYKDGSRDGQLVVVSRDLASAHYATGIATRLQQVLDDWNFLSPQLQTLSQSLNHGKTRHAFAFDPAQCMAPLPRAFRWVDGDGFASHAERLGHGVDVDVVRSSRVSLRNGAGDRFLAPRDEIDCAPGGSVDIEAKLAVVTGDVEAGIAPDAALERVRLVMLAGDVVLRDSEARPSTAFSPVAVTPDELAPGWQGGRLNFNLEVHCLGKRLGLVAAGSGMTSHFGQLVAAAAGFRGIAAGSIVGSGTVSHPDASRGFACLAEKRAQEIADGGVARTAFMQPGDLVRIDMKGADGQSLFGSIELRGIGDAPALDALQAAPR